MYIVHLTSLQNAIFDKSKNILKSYDIIVISY